MKKGMPFFWIDAFTQTPYEGNPCAVFFNADHLTDSQMQQIAFEMNLSETAFLLKSSKANFRARYFTPTQEIPLAGHPTIALFKALMENADIHKQGKHRYTLELAAGIIEINTDDEMIAMKQLAPVFTKVENIQAVLSAYQLKEEDLVSSNLYIVSTGTPFLLVQLKNKNLLQSLKVSEFNDVALVKTLNCFGAHFFYFENNTAFSRNFGPYPKYEEDPFTGSANGTMAAYLAFSKQLSNINSLVVHQGDYAGRPGKAQYNVCFDSGDKINSIEMLGEAVCLLRGYFNI